MGALTVVGLAVAVAPVAAVAAPGCLATAPVCAAEVTELATGGASGGSAVVGGGVVVGAVKPGSRPAAGGSLKFINAAEDSAPKLSDNCGACTIATDSTLAGDPMRAWDSGFMAPETLEGFFKGKFQYMEDGADGVRNELLKAGDGARGAIFAYQGGADIGHFFNVVDHGGNVKFLDGQAGGYADMDWDHWEYMPTAGGAK